MTPREQKIFNLAQADQAACRQFDFDSLADPRTICNARPHRQFIIPTRYAMAEQGAIPRDFSPAASTRSQPMALRRLRAGYLYLWVGEAPLQRYAVASDGLLLAQALDAPHSELATGQLAGLTLHQSVRPSLLYTERPLGQLACQQLVEDAGLRRRRMQAFQLTEAEPLVGRRCLPTEWADMLVAELLPQISDRVLAYDQHSNAAAYREAIGELGRRAQAAPTAANVQAYVDALAWEQERQQALQRVRRVDGLRPGAWSALASEVEATQAWLDMARQQAGKLDSSFAALEDDLGVLRDIDHAQHQLEAEHEQWLADNSLRQSVASFIRGLTEQSGAEVAGLLNYRYHEARFSLTPEQGDILLESRHELDALWREQARINQERGRRYSDYEIGRRLGEVRAREATVIRRLNPLLPPELCMEVLQLVREYQEEKRENLERTGAGAQIEEHIDLVAMNAWLDEQAPAHFREVERRHRQLYADRATFLRRHDNGTWFAELDNPEHQRWLDELAAACLSAQCLREEGARQFAELILRSDAGAFRLIFQGWSPNLEAAVNSASRLSELVAALGWSNLESSRAALARVLDERSLNSLQRLADDLQGSWAATVARLGAVLVQQHSGGGSSWAPSMGLWLVLRLGEQTSLWPEVERGVRVWQLLGEKATALDQWVRQTAKAIGQGQAGKIVNAPAVQNAGGLLPLGVLLVNVLNAGNQAGQGRMLEGGDEQRVAEQWSAYLYAGAALAGVVQGWLMVGKGLKELTGRLPFGISATAPTMTLFGAIVGGLSSVAAGAEFFALRKQIETGQSKLDPWLDLRNAAVTGQIATFGAQAILGLSLTVLRMANRITTPVAISRFRLGMAPFNLIQLALGITYFYAWARQSTPLQLYLANCCWSRTRAYFEKIEPQQQQVEFNELLQLLYQPRLHTETRRQEIMGFLGDIITEEGINRLIIDLPGALPETFWVELTLNGNPLPYTTGLFKGIQGKPEDLGPVWNKFARVERIPVEEGQGVRLIGGFTEVVSRLSVRLRYRSPLMQLAEVPIIGGEQGMRFTLRPNEDTISLRPDEPSPELDRAKPLRLAGKSASDQP